jgi:hypothetical protein
MTARLCGCVDTSLTQPKPLVWFQTLPNNFRTRILADQGGRETPTSEKGGAAGVMRGSFGWREARATLSVSAGCEVLPW